ncbi:MAG TPA: 3-hydroxyacyl-[acyl-carrier-protein] dehydratase FabZ [Terriglobia bacterium]|nr:3-hydroxyacyl-[acyl-carrier-protein] dehydratase FabZ [Terriglobia bacterium]
MEDQALKRETGGPTQPGTAESTGAQAELFQSAIQRILPHRYPFLLVDRVTEFVPGERIAGVKNFSAGDYAAQGQPDGAATAPVGILMEIVTQLGAILVLGRPEMAGKVAVILQIPQARMLRPVVAGDHLEVEAEVVKMRETFGELRGAIHCEGGLVAEGQMRFAIANAADLRSP